MLLGGWRRVRGRVLLGRWGGVKRREGKGKWVFAVVAEVMELWEGRRS